MFLYALLRIKQPENLKEYQPDDLGRIVGLDRAPEMKTVRRKTSQMAQRKRGMELMNALAQQRIAKDQDRVAFLYLDGHVREYYGKHRLFQAKKAQRQVVTPAATDTWVHDAYGEPLLVVTSEVNAQLTQVLEPILADVRRLLPKDQRVTVIFDRGGFSAKLFTRLIDAGFDVISYRKGKLRKLPRRRFTVQRQEIDGMEREYEVCDRRGSAWASVPRRRGTSRKGNISGCGKCASSARTVGRRRLLPTVKISRSWRCPIGCSIVGVRRTISSTWGRNSAGRLGGVWGRRTLPKGPIGVIPPGWPLRGG